MMMLDTQTPVTITFGYQGQFIANNILHDVKIIESFPLRVA